MPKTLQTPEILPPTVYMAQILSSLIMITNIFNTFVRTKASTARIKEVFDSAGDFNGGGEAKKLNGDIEFDNVTFAYPEEAACRIKNLSFSVKRTNLGHHRTDGKRQSTVTWLLCVSMT